MRPRAARPPWELLSRLAEHDARRSGRRASGYPLVALLVALAVAVVPAVAEAKQFLRVERVEVEPTFAKLARVRVWANVMHLEGSLVQGVKPEHLNLVVAGMRRGEVPLPIAWEHTDDELVLALVVQISSDFASAVEDLEEPLPKLLASLPKRSRVSLTTYGDRVRVGPLESLPGALRRWKRVVPDEEPSEPELVRAVDRALRQLAAAKPQEEGRDLRRLVLVVSDGIDVVDDPTAEEETQRKFRKLAKQANDGGITIHTIGYSIVDHRPPLRNLGELSKKTAGTFRWAQNRSAFGAHLEFLKQELRRQLVLTYLVPAAIVTGHKSIRVLCRSPLCGEDGVESNERRTPAPSCGGAECAAGSACVDGSCVGVVLAGTSMGWGGWLALLSGALALGGVGTAVVRRRRQAAARPVRPGMPGMPGAPGMPGGAGIPGAPGIPGAAHAAAMPGVAHTGGLAATLGGAQPAHGAATWGQPSAPPPHPSGRRWHLLFLNGPRQGQAVPLHHGFTIGKLAGCHLVIEDGYTSGHHAQFHIDAAGNVTVVDLGSTNGTYVNGVRTSMEKLVHGMGLRVGQTELRFIEG